MKFIHLSDTHLKKDRYHLYGLDPYLGLDMAIKSINKYHSDADFIVLTGDLADTGEIEAYEKIQTILRGCKMPTIKMMGNHDNRENFLQTFQDSMSSGGFVQGVLAYDKLACIFLDSKIPNTHAGDMCDERFRWFEQQLIAQKDKDIFVFIHHPPMDIGIQEMDDIKFQSSHKLREIFTKYRHIKYLFFGHLHMAVSGIWAGVPYFGIRGTNHQLSTKFSDRDFLMSSKISPAYGIVCVDKKDIHVRLHEYLEEDFTYTAFE